MSCCNNTSIALNLKMQSKLKLPLISNFMRLGQSRSRLILNPSSVYLNKGAFNCTSCLKLLLSSSSPCTHPELLLTGYNSFLWYLMVVICLHHVLWIHPWGKMSTFSLPLCFSGLYDAAIESDWRWGSDCMMPSYTRWAPGEPGNSTGLDQDCATLNGVTGGWTDQICTNTLLYICEIKEKSKCCI